MIVYSQGGYIESEATRRLIKTREHAKEITKECEKRGYTVGEVDLLVAVLRDEISRCMKANEKIKFKALEIN